MDKIFLTPRAKINVALDVIKKRSDGYHELDTIMQTVSLHDELYIKKIDAGKIEFSVDSPFLITNNDNLVYRAALYMMNRFNITCGVHIELKKNIPVSAGLGGGSADCAAALVGMRDLFELPVSDGELIKLSERFGADVPFCIKGGTARARGKGELLEALPPHPRVNVLIVRPPEKVSTAEVFNEFIIGGEYPRPDIDKVVEGINKNDLRFVASGMGNVLESVTEKKLPQIARVKKIMTAKGALCASMSGSGPCVFGYFEKKSDMDAAGFEIREKEGIDEIFSTDIFMPKD